MPGLIRIVTERGDCFHYAKVLASDPYVIRRLIGLMKGSDVRIHTIQYFSKQSKIEDLL